MQNHKSEQALNDEVHLPQSWMLLRQQVLHLAQFGGSVQVICGAKGAGKTTFLTSLCEASSNLEFICLSANNQGGVQDLFNQLADALGLLLPTRSSVGQQIAAMRSFAQALEKEQERAVIAIDNAERLDESALAALVSVLQGHSDSGFGLHFIFFSEPGLPEKIDQLHLLDVTVHDAYLPAFSHQDVAKLIELRSPLVNLQAVEIKAIWRSSEGLPGGVLDAASNLPKPEKRSGFLAVLSALPFGHGIALAVLVFVLVWALLVRDNEQEAEDSALVAQGDGQVFHDPRNADQSQLSNQSVLASNGSEPPLSVASISSNALSQPIQSQVEVLVKEKSGSARAEDNVGSKVDNNIPPKGKNAEKWPSSSTAGGIAKESGLEDSAAGVSAPLKVEEKSSASSTSSLRPVNAAPASKAALNSLSQRQDSWLETSYDYVGSLPNTGFMLQIMALSDFESLKRFAMQQENFENLHAYKIQRNGQVLYVLIEGFYADKDSAVSAVKNLPNAQKRGGPWPKSVETIKRERLQL